MSGRPALAVDIGGTRLRAALVEPSGRVLHRDSRATPATEGAGAVVAAVAEACRAVLAAAGRPAGLKLGLCAPGPLDAEAGIALATPTIRGFSGFPLRDKVSEALGLPVVIENDGPAAALGEWRFGAGRGLRDFVYVTLSTGIGGGIIAGGRLLRGRLGIAGHVGHMPLDPQGAICACGQRGCWEAQASGPALAEVARQAGFPSLETAFAAATGGDRAGRAFAEEAADRIAPGLVAVAHVMSPEAIILGGGVSNAFDLLKPLLDARFTQRALLPFRSVELRRAALGDNSGLLGAASLVLDDAGTA